MSFVMNYECYAYTHIHNTFSSNRDQKKAPDFLELEIQVILGLDACVWKPNPDPLQEHQELFTIAPSLQLRYVSNA